MKNSDTNLVNPYHEKFPELSHVFSDLSTAVKPTWYEKIFLLDLNSYYIKFRRSSFAQFIIGGLAMSMVYQVFLPENAQFENFIFPWAICFLMIHGVIYILLALHRHYKMLTQVKMIKIVEGILGSIHESSWRELRSLLMDLQNTDQYMAVDTSDRHKKISHHLANVLLSEPSSFSKLNALEYLFADYPDASSAGLNPFDSTNKVKETYFGYLSKLQRRNRVGKKFTAFH